MTLLFSFFSLFLSVLEDDIQLTDHIYDSSIKTVRIFPLGTNPEIKLLPAVSNLGGAPLALEFDDLQNDRVNYYAKIIACDYNWQKSSLHDLDFLEHYNEFNIDEFEYSSNTQTPYVHYQFTIPQVKLPGNYVLLVYRDGDLSQLALSK